MELYGQAHPVVYGDSTIRGGSISGLSGTVRPDALCTLDLIQKGYFGLWWAVLTPRKTSSTCMRAGAKLGHSAPGGFAFRTVGR
jgi:hypothetical protein